MAVGAALYERLLYAEDGGCVTGSLLDYALPTASMIPELEILHQETPSPVTPLGAKGVAEGNPMSTPACIANGVADALGVAEVDPPLTPERGAGVNSRSASVGRFGTEPRKFGRVHAREPRYTNTRKSF